MQTLCLYCWQTLRFEQSVQGQLFCSVEHRESYLQGQILLNFGRPDEAPELAGLIRSNPATVESPDLRARRVQTAGRILQILDARKVELPAMPAAIVPTPRLGEAAPAELLSIHAGSIEPVPPPAIAPIAENPVNASMMPSQLDPIVRFAARVGGFGPFKPQRSLRPWAFSAIAAGLTLGALLWSPSGNGAPSLVMPVSAAAPPEAVASNLVNVSRPCSNYLPALNKSRGIVIDGRAMGPIRTAEFPGASLRGTNNQCGNRQLASNRATLVPRFLRGL